MFTDDFHRLSSAYKSNHKTVLPANVAAAVHNLFHVLSKCVTYMFVFLCVCVL